jgi:hypothetical protein
LQGTLGSGREEAEMVPAAVLTNPISPELLLLLLLLLLPRLN